LLILARVLPKTARGLLITAMGVAKNSKQIIIKK
jgi:hypothetical protein